MYQSINPSKDNQSLEQLDLMMNGLSNQGAILMGNMLANNNTLMELNLSNNRIEKDGADVFASKFEINRRLRKLWVRECQFLHYHIPLISSKVW